MAVKKDSKLEKPRGNNTPKSSVHFRGPKVEIPELPNITRKELSFDLQDYCYLNPNESRIAIQAFFEIIKRNIIAGEEVKLSSFGTFSSVKKESRPGRNLHTGEKVEVSARRVVRFKPSKKQRYLSHFKVIDERLLKEKE